MGTSFQRQCYFHNRTLSIIETPTILKPILVSEHYSKFILKFESREKKKGKKEMVFRLKESIENSGIMIRRGRT